MTLTLAILLGVWVVATFAIAAVCELLRVRRPSRGLPQTRHPRTQVRDEGVRPWTANSGDGGFPLPLDRAERPGSMRAERGLRR